MESLIRKSDVKPVSSKGKKERYLYGQMIGSKKLIIVFGYRGSGKTTLLLQVTLSAIQGKGLYLSLDDFYFETPPINRSCSIPL